MGSDSMIILSCDPGVTGAIACYHTERGLLERARLPTKVVRTIKRKTKDGVKNVEQKKIDATRLREMIRQWSATHGISTEFVVGVVEEIQPFSASKASAGSLVSLGRSEGLVEGILTAWAGLMLNPSPSHWKKAMGLSKDKKESVAAAKERFGITMGHDLAEACLLCVWGANEVNGEQEAA
jgi:hypothetical protein